MTDYMDVDECFRQSQHKEASVALGINDDAIDRGNEHMSNVTRTIPSNVDLPDLQSVAAVTPYAKGTLTQFAAVISDRKISFWVSYVGLIVMLLWAGAYKMTSQGAESIIPLVSHSPLISWHFKVFGPYVGATIIGGTEWSAAICLILGSFKPKIGIVGGAIAVVMFLITSTMVLSTPDSTTLLHGMRYLSLIGLFLFKDIISLGVSFYLVAFFGRKAVIEENSFSQV